MGNLWFSPGRAGASVTVNRPEGAMPTGWSEGGVRIHVTANDTPVFEAALDLGGKSEKIEFVSDASVPIVIESSEKSARFELGQTRGDSTKASLSLREGSASITATQTGNTAIALGAHGIAGLLPDGETG